PPERVDDFLVAVDVEPAGFGRDAPPGEEREVAGGAGDGGAPAAASDGFAGEVGVDGPLASVVGCCHAQDSGQADAFLFGAAGGEHFEEFVGGVDPEGGFCFGGGGG